jgi:hypothetical protein
MVQGVKYYRKNNFSLASILWIFFGNVNKKSSDFSKNPYYSVAEVNWGKAKKSQRLGDGISVQRRCGSI